VLAADSKNIPSTHSLDSDERHFTALIPYTWHLMALFPMWLVLAFLAVLVGCGGARDLPTTAQVPPAVPTQPAPIPIIVVSLPAPGSPIPPPGAPTPPPPGAPTFPSPAAPCTNGNLPVFGFSFWVYSVRDSRNELRSPNAIFGAFHVGDSVRFEGQGFDVYGRPTDGCTGDGPHRTWRPDDVVDWNGGFGWMPSAKVLSPGVLTVTGDFEGVSLEQRYTLVQ
jgi:hypothetical protein